jgi:hypothetical protein
VVKSRCHVLPLVKRRAPRPRMQAFYRMMLAPPCSGRVHWGKAGQPWAEPCFDGAAQYPQWCDFGCAVQARGPGRQPSLAGGRRAGLPVCR